MTQPPFKPPKEFGDRSDLGLGSLRSLRGVDVPFMKSNPTDGVVVSKNNGFDTVTKRPLPAVTLGRYVTQGRFRGQTNASVMLSAGGLRNAPYRLQQLSVIGGIGGAMTLGSNRTLVATSLDSSGNIKVWRAKTFTSKVPELTTTTTPALSVFTIAVTPSCYYETSAIKIEYECLVTSFLDGTNNVLPKVFYSSAGTWTLAATVGYNNYDHYTYFQAQIRPNLLMIAHGVVPRGAVFDQGTRSATPNGQVPYPLFQVSTDYGRTFQAISLAYLFAGSTNEYMIPRVAGTVGVTGTGGYSAVITFQVLCLPESIFLSMEIPVDTATPLSITSGGYQLENRIFKSNGLDLSSFTRVTSPPGYGTVWGGPLQAVFSESSPNNPGHTFGAIGYLGLAVNQDTPNMLHVSLDGGLSWQPPRFLPAIGRWCAYVQDITTRELTCSVFEPTSPPQIVRYSSSDLGLTWQRRQVIAVDVIDLTTSGSISDFYFLIPVNQDDGSPPTMNPMSGWRYDSRIPRFITH